MARKAYNLFLNGVSMKIKVVEEDFKVDEIFDLSLKKFEDLGEHPYAYFLITKKGRNTPDVVNEIARRLRINTKSVGFAGNKDKHAITSQYVSIPFENQTDVENFLKIQIENVSIDFIGWSDERINLGDLIGNKFEIIVRGLDDIVEFKQNKIKNYFGPQRFGIKNINVDVGRAIIKKDFRKACKLIGLEVEENNYVNALKRLENRTLRFYVGAYQSYLWNYVAERIDGLDKLEVLGFFTEFEDETAGKIYKEIMDVEGIKKEDFMIKQIKEASVEGTERKLYLDVQNFKFSWTDDDMIQGKKKCILSFVLGKGSYATVVVDSLFS